MFWSLALYAAGNINRYDSYLVSDSYAALASYNLTEVRSHSVVVYGFKSCRICEETERFDSDSDEMNHAPRQNWNTG